MLPALGSYRLVHIFWNQQVPLNSHSSLIANVDDVLYPALAVVKVQALRKESHDLLVLRPNHSLFLLSGPEYYSIGLAYDGAKHTDALRVMWMGEETPPVYPGLNAPVKVEGLQQGVGTEATLRVSSKVHIVSFDLAPKNLLTCNSLDILRYALPLEKWNLMRRYHLQLWISKGQPKDVAEEVDCLWTAVFSVLNQVNPSFLTKDVMSMDHLFNKMALSTSHRCLADDPILAKFKLPQRQSKGFVGSTSALSPLAAPVLFALHLLGQSLKVDVTRFSELPFLLRALLRLSSQIAPEWTDYWSRIFPDMDEAWKGPGLGKRGPLKYALVTIQKVNILGIPYLSRHQTL